MKKGRVYDYVVVLKNPHKKTIEKTGWLLSFLAVLPYAVAVYSAPEKWILYIFLLLFAFLLMSNIIDKSRNKKIRFSPLLVVSGLGLSLFSSIGFIGLLYVLAGVVENYVARNNEIGFSSTTILIRGLFSRKTTWSALNNVLIKDGLLTMDYKNNTLFQAYTDDQDNDEYDVEDSEFNTYCREQLKKARALETHA